MNRPSARQPEPYAADTETEFPVPCGNVLRFSFVRKHVGIPLVFTLLNWCLPLAIFWGVIAVCGSPSNTVLFGWACPHVGEEVSQSITSYPPRAHLYASLSVILVAWIAFAVASTLHGFPGTVSIGANDGAAFINNPVGVSSRDASTRFCVTGPQVHRVDINKIPAIAPTCPSGFSRRDSERFSKNGEAMIFLSGKIKFLWHIYVGF